MTTDAERPRRQRAVRLAGRLIALLPAVAALCYALGVLPIPLLDLAELSLGDARMRSLAPHTRDERIVIVDIDERSLEVYGRFPWRRSLLAHLSRELLERQRVAVLGFDMVFPEEDNRVALATIEGLAAGPLRDDSAFQAQMPGLREALDHDARFAAALQGQPVVLGFFLSDSGGGRIQGMLPDPLPVMAGVGTAAALGLPQWRGFAGNLGALNLAAPRAGFINSLPDEDGRVRSVPLLGSWVPQQGEPQLHQALSIAMLRAWLGDAELSLQVADSAGRRKVAAVRLAHARGELQLPVDERGALRVAFRGEGGTQGGSFQYLSAVELLQGRLPEGALAGKLVLVGTSVPSLTDLRATPMGSVYPGVEIHASVLSAALDGRLIVSPDWVSGYGVFSVLVLVALVLVLQRRLRAQWAMTAMAALAIAFVALDQALLHSRGWLLPLALPLAALLATAVLGSLQQYWVEGRERRAIERLFGTYVPPEIVQRMAKDPHQYRRAGLGAENRELTILFCDLRNFTQVAQGLTPDALREVVNLFFSRMTAVIRAHDGTLDKFIGDAIMAFWGAPLETPDHAARAVGAALEMREQLDGLNALLRERGLPPIGLGIGLNTGVVCVGDLGSDLRRSYTVIGDAVNLASRIEGLTREYGLDLLVGEATVQAVPGREWVEIDRVRVKGRDAPVRLFTPLEGPVPEGSGRREELRAWSLALAAYRRQDWPVAHGILSDLVARHGARRLHTRLLDLIAQYRLNPPPPDWDGVHRFDSK